MKKLTSTIIIVVIAAALIAVPVLAHSYTASISVTESSSNDYTQLPIIATINNQYLIDNGYITSTGLDTKVLKGGSELPHMLTGDKTLFCSNINASEQTNFNYTLGNSALDAFPVIVGYSGYITVSDHADLELGDSFEIELRGYVDTSAGSDKNLIFKNAAFKLYISAAGSIKAEITGGTSVTATSISSGVHTIEVTANETDLKIYVDTVEKDSSALGGVGVPDNTNNWTIMQNNCILYMEYFKIWIAQ